MKQKIKILLILFSFTGIIESYAQVLSVQTKVDTNIILIGDQVEFSLEVNQPLDFKLGFPVLTDTIIDKIEIVEKLGIDTTRSDNQLLIRHKYLLTSFDSGIYIIPPFHFTFTSYIDSSIDTISTTPFYFGVQTMALDTANPDQIADIKLPYHAPLTFKELVPYIGIGLGVLLVIAFVIYFFIKKKRNEPILIRKPKPKEPAHVIAYRELDKLKRDKLWQKNLVKEYHSQLTDIVRIYLEDRYLVSAMEQTTDEILDSFKINKLLDSILFEALEKMLKQADLVKFAKAIPLSDENEQSLKDAYMIIDRTKEVFRSTLEDEKKEENDLELDSEKLALGINQNDESKITDS